VRAALAVALLVLAACKPAAEVTGSPEPPDSFGKVATAARGCPDVSGVYAWPFVAGPAQGFNEDGGYRRNGYAEFFGLTMPEQGELEIRPLANRKGQGLHFIARPIEKPISRTPQRVQPPTHQRFGDERIHCKGGWVMVEEYDLPQAGARAEYGPKVRVGAKLAPLANGDLAIGQWLRVTERKASWFTWGEQSVGDRRLADRIEWFWSRYQRSRLAPGPPEK
jgi:hypothetical protein